MPCSVSREEEEFYERSANLREYGESELTQRITERVACELSHVIETNGLLGCLTPTARKWIEIHKAKDEERGAN